MKTVSSNASLLPSTCAPPFPAQTRPNLSPSPTGALKTSVTYIYNKATIRTLAINNAHFFMLWLLWCIFNYISKELLYVRNITAAVEWMIPHGMGVVFPNSLGVLKWFHSGNGHNSQQKVKFFNEDSACARNIVNNIWKCKTFCEFVIIDCLKHYW